LNHTYLYRTIAEFYRYLGDMIVYGIWGRDNHEFGNKLSVTVFVNAGIYNYYFSPGMINS